MPGLSYFFTGSSVTSSLTVLGSLVAFVSAGVGWYRAAVTEEKTVIEKQANDAQAERQRHYAILERLTQEWIAEKGDGIPNKIMMGVEFAPKDWLDRRLSEMGETWKAP